MAFIREENRVPTTIGKIAVTLIDYDGTAKSARFQVQVLDADGDIMDVKRGNLQPHLTSAQINDLLAFMADLRTQAESEILPV